MSDNFEAMLNVMRSQPEFGVSARNIIHYVTPDGSSLYRRPAWEVRARAATSRYWAQRLRWLRKRGRA